MVVSINNTPVMSLLPRYAGKKISIAIDASKTNTGITIGDEYCEPIDVIEFYGKDDGTTKEAALVLCQKQRQALGEILKGAEVVIAGIEDIITKKGQEGVRHHESRLKITAVFMSFIFFLQDNFGICPELINNQSWKSTVLPEKYNKEGVGKGSWHYFRDIGSKYGNYSDDATDSLCIMKYLKIKHNLNRRILVDAVERGEHPCIIEFRDRLPVGRDVVLFTFNKELTAEENAQYVANRLGLNEVGACEVPVDYLTYKDIYRFTRGVFSPGSTKALMVIVGRES